MKLRLRIGLALVGFHLAVVACCAAKARWLGHGWTGSLIAWYSGISGANTQYGFFAPNVGTQFRAFFDLTDARGARRTEVLEPDASGEVDIRMSNVIALFGSAVGNAKIQRALVASWAGKIFGRHPEAREVWVRIEAYELPSMEGFRAGIRPAWKEIYRAKLVLRPGKADRSFGVFWRPPSLRLLDVPKGTPAWARLAGRQNPREILGRLYPAAALVGLSARSWPRSRVDFVPDRGAATPVYCRYSKEQQRRAGAKDAARWVRSEPRGPLVPRNGGGRA